MTLANNRMQRTSVPLTAITQFVILYHVRVPVT